MKKLIFLVLSIFLIFSSVMVFAQEENGYYPIPLLYDFNLSVGFGHYIMILSDDDINYTPLSGYYTSISLYLGILYIPFNGHFGFAFDYNVRLESSDHDWSYIGYPDMKTLWEQKFYFGLRYLAKPKYNIKGYIYFGLSTLFLQNEHYAVIVNIPLIFYRITIIVFNNLCISMETLRSIYSFNHLFDDSEYPGMYSVNSFDKYQFTIGFCF